MGGDPVMVGKDRRKQRGKVALPVAMGSGVMDHGTGTPHTNV
jgi:hypothetical protein